MPLAHQHVQPRLGAPIRRRTEPCLGPALRRAAIGRDIGVIAPSEPREAGGEEEDPWVGALQEEGDEVRS